LRQISRTTLQLTLSVLTWVAIALASTAGVHSKAAFPSADCALRIQNQQNRYPDVTTLPLRKWLAKANDLKVAGQLELNSRAELTADVKLGSDCAITNVVIKQKAGDPKLFDVAGDLVAAIGDSGLLRYVGDRGEQYANTRCVETTLRLGFSSDSDEVTASLEYPASSADRANQIARGYSIMIDAGRTIKRGDSSEPIYNVLSSTADGNQIILHFRMTRTAIEEMIKRALKGL
jgi:hypothetical protein